MTKAATASMVFGWYLVVVGMALAGVPNALLGFFGLPPTSEVWIRVLGLVVTTLGLYYILASRAELVAFFRWSVWVRPIVLLGFVIFVAVGWAAPVLLLFGAIDAAGAVWTWLALRNRPTACGLLP